MGVYIKGMEMPKEIEPGLVIEFADGIDGKRYARLYHYRNGGLTEWLEAVPVPPHGRLGDLDALYESCALDTNIDVMASAKRINEYMQLKIDEAPTVIEADEVKEL